MDKLGLQNIDAIRKKYDDAMNRIKNVHIKKLYGEKDEVLLVSNTYPGVWLEHVYDALMWASLEPGTSELARSQARLFLDRQKDDGQLPCYVCDAENPEMPDSQLNIGYGQTQECVSFASLCLDIFLLERNDEFLKYAYEGCSKWNDWLVNNRMTLNKGLIELFCEFDSGHDNSARFHDIERQCPNADAKLYAKSGSVPLFSPDLNAVFYGSKIALGKMAEILGKYDESKKWYEESKLVRELLIKLCYDKEDEFFYDTDKHGNFRKYRSIQITNVFTEHVLCQNIFDIIYEKYMKNPNEFWTPYPFPSMSISDLNAEVLESGNTWGYFSQALTTLRCTRWMDFYGKSDDFDTVLRKWVYAFVNSKTITFGQELYPLTGEQSVCSEWYSSAMLVYIYAVRRLGYIT